MQYCSNCHVKVRGNKKKCPLCKNTLPISPVSSDTDEVYPKIPLSYERHMAIRIMVFISIVTIVTSFVINKLFPSDVNWPMLVLFGLLSTWLSLIVVIQKRRHLTKNIMWQVTIVSVLSILWDWGTGWRGWSLDYLVPTICVAAMFVMFVTAKVMKLSIRDYITYLLLDGLLGIVPIIFIIFNWVKVLYPSLISVAVSIIFLSAILIFQGENIKMELNKRMHI